MKPRLCFFIISFFVSQLLYSQNKTSVITEAYKVAFGIDPPHSELNRLKSNKSLHYNSFNDILQFLNAKIFKKREVEQRQIIERAYLNVLKRKATKEEVEGYYATTNRKSKNYTELCNEIRSFFRSEIDYPE